MSQKSQDAIDVLSEVIVDTIDKKLGTAKFDKSQTGVVTAVNGNTYTIAVFGSQYNITSDQVFTVGQSVVVTALQGDMKRLVCSPDNVGTMKTVDSKVKIVGDKLSSFIDKDFSNTLKQIDKIKGQVDESFMSWFYDGAPTNETAPAKDWTTEDAKRVHIGDLYYDTTSGYSYEWVVSDGVYSWNKITDSGIQEALKNASKAQDTADRKRRIFYDTPSTPYDRGDMWAQGTAGDLLICNVMRSITDSYHQTDWIPASKYTDDTKANEALDSANKANGDLASFKIAYDSDLKVTKEEIEARVTKVTYQENVNSTTDALSSLNKKVAQAETTIKQNSDDITLRATKEELLAAKSDAEEDAAEKANTAESNSKKYADSQIKIATDNIQLKVDEKIGKDEVSEAVKSQIEINKDSIASTVMSKITGEEIVSKIEQTPEAVKISAGKIELTGAVTIKNGKTVLDSDAVNNSITQIDGSKIKTGTLDAKKIKAGTITATEIKADTITAGNIASGQIIRKLWQNATAGTYKASNGVVLPFQMSTFPAQLVELEYSDLSQIQIIFKGNRFQSGSDNDKNCLSFSSMLVPLFDFSDLNAGSDNAVFYTVSVPLPSSRYRVKTEEFFVPYGTPAFSFRSFQVHYAKNTSGIGGYLDIYFWDAAIQNQDGSISFGANYNDWCIPYRIFGMK